MRLWSNIFAILFLVSTVAFAQEESASDFVGSGGGSGIEDQAVESSASIEAAPKGGPRKSIRVQFDDELVKGSAMNPEMEFINARKEFNFNKMLNLRKNYLPEVRKKRGSFDP